MFARLWYSPAIQVGFAVDCMLVPRRNVARWLLYGAGYRGYLRPSPASLSTRFERKGQQRDHGCQSERRVEAWEAMQRAIGTQRNTAL